MSVMNTPIFDYVKSYCEKNPLRLHMPGHKGKRYLGCEHLDITEIGGADDLYSANGIIRESEENASSLFRTAHSFYSTEGSSLCIRAMVYLTALYARQMKKPLKIFHRKSLKAKAGASFGMKNIRTVFTCLTILVILLRLLLIDLLR